MITIKWVKLEEADNIPDDKDLGCSLGLFSEESTWKEYKKRYKPQYHYYLESLRKSIIFNRIWHGGDWHQNDENLSVPITSDGYKFTYSYHAWADLLSAIWSDHLEEQINYIKFFREEYLLPKPSEDKFMWADERFKRFQAEEKLILKHNDLIRLADKLYKVNRIIKEKNEDNILRLPKLPDNLVLVSIKMLSEDMWNAEIMTKQSKLLFKGEDKTPQTAIVEAIISYNRFKNEQF